MQHPTEGLTPLYVRLPREEADLLDRAAFEGKTSKRELVTDAVRAHLGLEQGRVEFRPAPADPPPVLTLAEVADLLQAPEGAVEELAEAGELPGRQIGGDWRFARAAVLAWLSHSD
jgi:excisionase family DNA binding protein